MDNKFAIGDTVRLKSGSPVMTVDFFDKDRGYSCVYFFDGKFYGLTSGLYFSEVVLEKVAPDSDGSWVVSAQ